MKHMAVVYNFHGSATIIMPDIGLSCLLDDTRIRGNYLQPDLGAYCDDCGAWYFSKNFKTGDLAKNGLPTTWGVQEDIELEPHQTAIAFLDYLKQNISAASLVVSAQKQVSYMTDTSGPDWWGLEHRKQIWRKNGRITKNLEDLVEQKRIRILQGAANKGLDIGTYVLP
jgi:hypothetical protein